MLYRPTRTSLSSASRSPAHLRFRAVNPSPLLSRPFILADQSPSATKRAYHPTQPGEMRLPYAPVTAPSDSPPETKDIYAAVSARRSPRPLQPLDLALLHSPPIASGWNAFLGAVRSGSLLPGASVQEVSICRVAVLNRAAYEWDAHGKLAVKGADGVGREGMGTILAAGEFVGSDAVTRLEGLRKAAAAKDGREGTEGGLTGRQWVVLAYTDQMTRNVQVDDGVWAAVREEFDERESVELTATIAAYNCVSRFLAALDVGERNRGEMTIPDEAR